MSGADGGLARLVAGAVTDAATLPLAHEPVPADLSALGDGDRAAPQPAAAVDRVVGMEELPVLERGVEVAG